MLDHAAATAASDSPSGEAGLAPSSPVKESDRILSLDVLRGFSLLGVLVINIQSFAMTDAAYVNPNVYGDLSGANYAAWLLGHVLADQKFMAIFSMLFGAGIVLMTRNREAAGAGAAAFHYRRMGALLLFGMLHAYLLWVGDILYTFAVCGMVLYPFRKLPPGALIALGTFLLLMLSSFAIISGRSMASWSPDRLERFIQENWQPPPREISNEVATFRSGWFREIAYRAPIALELETHLLLIRLAWRAGGLILIGMGLFKLGVFTASCSRTTYLGLVAVGALLGMPLILYGVHLNFAMGWDPRYSFFIGSQFNYWGSILMGLGWVGVVMLACQNRRLLRAARPLAAVGQTALSNYLLHTILCSFIFYGIGLGLFGQVSRVGQLLIVLAIWVVQLILSPLWLRYFRFGPVEWLWRSMTYLSWQPMRRTAPRSTVVSLTG